MADRDIAEAGAARLARRGISPRRGQADCLVRHGQRLSGTPARMGGTVSAVRLRAEELHLLEQLVDAATKRRNFREGPGKHRQPLSLAALLAKRRSAVERRNG